MKLTLHIPKDYIHLLKDFRAKGGNLSKLLRDALDSWKYEQTHEAEVFYKELAFNVFGGLRSSQ